MPQLEKIIIYPIKSIGHIELKNSIVNEEGLEWDRKWMLVNDQGKFITQREFPELNLIRIKELETDFLIMDPENNFVLVPKYISSSSSIIKFEVEIWDATFDAEVWNPLASQWISDYLEQRVMLVRMIDKSRIKKSEYWKQEFPIYFSDAYPILLVNHNSVKEISNWCEQEIHYLQFRPNILINGIDAFAEDELKSFWIGQQQFDIIKPCERCIISTIKPHEAKFNKEPLSALAKKRKFNNKVHFGIYAIPVLGESGKFETIGLNQELKLEFK